MRITKFKRMKLIDGVWSLTISNSFIDRWEIAFGQSHLNQKLNGDMAEIITPAEPWHIRLWLWFHWSLKR